MDRLEFTKLYERLRRPLFAYAATRVSGQAALDVVHDTFEVVWAKRAEAPADTEQQVCWCFGIARNKVLQENQRTRRKHHDNRFIEDVGMPLQVLEDVVADTVVEVAVGKAVWESLTPEDQNLLIMLASTDLPGEDVAHLVGVSYAAYRRRVSRLRKRVRGRLNFNETDATVDGGGAA